MTADYPAFAMNSSLKLGARLPGSVVRKFYLFVLRAWCELKAFPAWLGTFGTDEMWLWPSCLFTFEGKSSIVWFASAVAVVASWLSIIDGFGKWLLFAVLALPVVEVCIGLDDWASENGVHWLTELPLGLLSGFAFCFLLFFVIWFPFATIYRIYSMGYWREICALTALSLLQLALLEVKRDWINQISILVGVGATSCAAFLLFHLVSDSFLNDDSVVTVEVALSKVLERFRHPFGPSHKSVSLGLVFVALFLLAWAVESVSPRVGALNRLKTVKAIVSQFKFGLLTFVCFSLVMSRTEQLGLRNEAKRIRDAKHRARTEAAMCAEIAQMNTLQKMNMIESLQKVMEDKNSSEVAENAAEDVYWEFINETPSEASDGKAERIVTAEDLGSMSNAEAERAKAEEEQARSYEGLRRAFQTALDEVNTATIKFAFSSESPVVDVLISAVVKVASNLEYSETQSFATRVIETFATSSKDPASHDRAPGKLYGDVVVGKAKEEVEKSHITSTPHVGDFEEKPREVEVR